MKLSDLTLYDNTVLIPETDIEVNQYISIEDKNSIITMALQNSEDDTVYNECKLKMYFELYIAYMYSNIEFTEDDKDDPVKTYDILASNGIIQDIITALPQVEYIELCNMLAVTKENKMKYKNSLASLLNHFIFDLPENAEAARNIIKEFNPEDYQEIIKFAKNANGGREI
jgi:hypothetical protein